MKSVVLTLLALIPGIAFGQNTDHVIIGPGAGSCGYYLEQSKQKEQSLIFVLWVQGFLSGINVADKNSGKPWIYMPDAETIKAYLDLHCREQPLSTPYEGATLMYDELRQRQKSNDAN